LTHRMDATRFTYIGPPAYAGALAQELEARGLSVDYEPPMETKDLALAMSAVAVVFAATGPIKDIVSSVSLDLSPGPCQDLLKVGVPAWPRGDTPG